MILDWIRLLTSAASSADRGCHGAGPAQPGPGYWHKNQRGQGLAIADQAAGQCLLRFSFQPQLASDLLEERTDELGLPCNIHGLNISTVRA